MMKLSYFNKMLLNNSSKSNNYFNNIYLHTQITSLYIRYVIQEMEPILWEKIHSSCLNWYMEASLIKINENLAAMKTAKVTV
jgi:hypothetical protein